ncbi:hypothetical protein ABT025_30815 [Streptomyces sp. NPDC002809]|uniref:hypothetical protein n=1 Tax=Streptomyces sp. NPDC002809 TaxID=3154433 RepID=UPI003317EC05
MADLVWLTSMQQSATEEAQRIRECGVTQEPVTGSRPQSSGHIHVGVGVGVVGGVVGVGLLRFGYVDDCGRRLLAVAEGGPDRPC